MRFTTKPSFRRKPESILTFHRAGEGTTSLSRGVQMRGPEGIMLHSPSPGLKTNPPYPPLSGGYEKATPAAGRGTFVFSCPPDKGG